MGDFTALTADNKSRPISDLPLAGDECKGHMSELQG